MSAKVAVAAGATQDGLAPSVAGNFMTVVTKLETNVVSLASCLASSSLDDWFHGMVCFLPCCAQVWWGLNVAEFWMKNSTTHLDDDALQLNKSANALVATLVQMEHVILRR